ncbi:MAG TPA: tRNA lysidine(34) synthetase TilS [Dongiaceae bacterium]|nr:tRNA lysidine(34) synthetase TilS [Dongiaceae bacterium]
MPEIDIAALMAPFGPFERPPSVAVAVSGGSDSLGLGLLLADWVQARDGRLIVLTVDHGLRAEAAAECARVAEIFAAIPNCSAHILRWDGTKPAHGLQAAARAARYALLADWCRAHGVMHLAVGHTADDQAETVAMRLAHGSGPAGLAGMAALRPERGVRLLRPLMSVSRAAVRDWLRARRQDWIDDPSNELTRFERVRIRKGLSKEGAQVLIERAQTSGVERDGLERAAAALLAEAAQMSDGGYVAIGLGPFLAAGREIQAMALRQITLSVSGADYASDFEDILLSVTKGMGGARTRGGCLFQALQGRLCVFREAAAIAANGPVAPGWTGLWDNRFGIRVAAGLSPTAGWTIGPLGEAGLRQVADRFGIRLKRHPMPLPARLALPALWQGEHLVSQPHLNAGEGLAAWPAPRHTVTTCGFTVAAGRPHTIYSSVPS